MSDIKVAGRIYNIDNDVPVLKNISVQTVYKYEDIFIHKFIYLNIFGCLNLYKDIYAARIIAYNYVLLSFN